ncbi:hypothetical protein [Tichowtungia aerotolerans]|uniref:STAS/SEC14 domain-containing protein n=1 Tax=Tichowtungia aerotolerans TaxID=2697043 RepID=A0A6P1M765_9BACT|nr:hypothetical protein [Tichowtungia aerotolerans]QHI69691.1 hypothetical protein GT409_09575 [Tichowtungia aerotolerans]
MHTASASTYKIVQKENYAEVHASGKLSPWDFLEIIYRLHRADPKKEKPDLWVFDKNVDFPLHSFPRLAQGVMNLLIRSAIKEGCRSAILTADEFQKAKAELYCAEAAFLPFEVRAFTDRSQALAWLLN